LAGLDRRNCGVAISGRVSLEIVTKAARAGIELIAAVSAVSSYAVSAAEKWNITLCGFVRPDKMNVYTKPERIISHDKIS
jgi:FdhD protein